MKQLLLLTVLLSGLNAFGQVQHTRVYSSFDNYPLSKSDTFDNGQDLHGGLMHFGRHFANDYNTSWQSWSGWAMSNMTDDTTTGYLNQYSAITASGVSSTENYMVAYLNPVITFDDPTEVSGAYFTNSTYAYLDMKRGSGFSKKFGGDDGTDEDYFLLKVYCFLGGELMDSSELYLADYRSSDNEDDYIINDWVYLDFNNDPYTDVDTDSMVFVFSSTDTSGGYMNTPAYFCMDDFNSLGEDDANGYYRLLEVPSDTFYNGSDMAGGFVDNYIFYPNTYNPNWQAYQGWAASTYTDTAGLTGLDLSYVSTSPVLLLDRNSNHYAVSYGETNEIRMPYINSDYGNNNWLHKTAIPAPWPSIIHITNTWYNKLDMENGSNWSKKFGGTDGTDPDYFRLLIKAKDGQDSTLAVDTIYLADYRFEDSEDDYILDQWHVYDLSNKGIAAHRLVFELQSSDTSIYGMNTPAYFAMSTFLHNWNVDEKQSAPQINVYPNPARDVLHVESDSRVSHISMYDLQGRIVIEQEATTLNTADLRTGMYILHITTDKGVASQRFFKQ